MKAILYMPALNESASLSRVIAELPRNLGQVDCVEILVIDDGSSDDTAVIARSAGAHVVQHSKNRGVGAAFHSAITFALENNADILVGIDADGQFDAQEIPALIQPILAGKADMVVGNRFENGRPKHMSPVKYWGNLTVARLVSSLCGQKFTDVSCGFRAYNREALMRLNIFGEFTYTHETILSLIFQGLSVTDHPIQVSYDPHRVSRVARSIVNYTLQTSKIILRVLLDYKPIQVFGSLGGLLFLMGAICELFLLGYYAVYGVFTPYKNIGFIGLGFGVIGLLILIIALISDMLNRIRKNQDRILYELKKSRYGR